jgi:hypothetical protein
MYGSTQVTISTSEQHKYNGDRSAQAEITTNLAVVPVPRGNGDYDSDLYPAKPATAPSVVMSGDLLIIDTHMFSSVTSTGKPSTGCFASFANREKPKPGKEDEWCGRYRVIGVAKNVLTDPGGAYSVPNGGIPRINSQRVAAMVGGSFTVKYTNPEPVIIGDAVIWHPPPEKKPIGSKDPRPTPVLGPLDWRIMENVMRNVCVCMLATHGGGSSALSGAPASASASGKASASLVNCARERKRSILVTIMVGLMILVRRGYVLILTPSVTKEMALKDALVRRMEDVVRAKATEKDKVAAMEAALVEYARRTSKTENDLGDNEGSHDFYYHDKKKPSGGGPKTANPLGAPQLPLGKYSREGATFDVASHAVVGLDTSKESTRREEVQENSLAWMISNLGLAGPSNFARNHVTSRTIYDVLLLDSLGALEEDDQLRALNLAKSRRGRSGMTEPLEVQAFLKHVRGHLAGQEVAWTELRDEMSRRIVATALSSSIGTSDAVGREDDQATLDINFGRIHL